MVVESKPLFHPEVIRQQLRHFILPAAVDDSRPRLKHWAELNSSGLADKLKETDLLPDFLTSRQECRDSLFEMPKPPEPAR